MPEAEDLNRTIAEITQTIGLQRRTFTLHPDRIDLAVSGPIDRYRTPFYLHSIKEEPDRIVSAPWRALVLSGLLIAGAAVMAVGPLHRRGGMIVAGGLGIVLALAQLPRIRREIVWFYRASSEGPRPRLTPHLYLVPGKPSRDEVSRFMEVLAATQKRHIAKMREEEAPPVPYTRELSRFAELRELKVVSDEEFAAVKAKLLNLRPRRIGF